MATRTGWPIALANAANSSSGDVAGRRPAGARFWLAARVIMASIVNRR
jgi:hypothetical protein